MSENGQHGEKAYKLTKPMLEAMDRLKICYPAPGKVDNAAVRQALERRGFIRNVIADARPDLDGVFWLTARGRTALRIAAQTNKTGECHVSKMQSGM